MGEEAETVAASEPLVGAVDCAIIIVVVVGAIVWYLKKNLKKRQESQYEFTPISGGPGLVRANTETGFVAKMQQAGRNVVVFYGSQTGTAEDLASRLAKDAARYGMKGVALDPEEVDIEELSQLAEVENNLAIFCMATYGEGDPTDNAQEFNEILQRGDINLAGVNFAVFGLGNKTYEHYNSMGKFCDQKLEELGAKRVHTLGLGDDDGNLEEDFMVWREGFWSSVCTFFDISSVLEDVSTRQFSLVVYEDYDPEKLFTGEIARLKSFVKQRPPYDSKNPYLAAIVENRELHTDGDRSCRHIEFEISEARIRYDAGDHLAVYPTNDPILVEKIGQILQVDLGQVISLVNLDEDSSKRHPFPCPCSYRTALLHYVDICTPPRTNVIKELADYCSDEQQKQFLLQMCSADENSRRQYSEWVLHDHRSVIDILSDISSCRPALDHLLEMLPRLQPRYYSISSSPKKKKGIVAITAIVLNYTTRLGRPVKGVATNWLALKTPNGLQPHKVPMFVRKSTLRLPHQTKTHIIMIGPGTGLAPFMGFIAEKELQIDEGKPVGQSILYFGCRNSKEDYIYQSELEGCLAKGVLSELHVAFSREQEQKVYVQHLLKQNAQKTWELLKAGAHVYVCGDARHMAREVHETVHDILKECGGLSDEEATAYLKKMDSQKRYQADVWF